MDALSEVCALKAATGIGSVRSSASALCGTARYGADHVRVLLLDTSRPCDRA